MQTLKTDTRKRILNVSKRLFLKKGFRETTTREIAREAGINLSNLYLICIIDGRQGGGRFLFWNKMKHCSLLGTIYG